MQLSKADYFPDITASLATVTRDNVPFLPTISALSELSLRMIFSTAGGAARSVRESEAQVSEAKENLARVTKTSSYDCRSRTTNCNARGTWCKCPKNCTRCAPNPAASPRNKLQKGAALQSQAHNAVAQEFDAKTVLLQSQLDYIQARDEVTEAMGQTPE